MDARDLYERVWMLFQHRAGDSSFDQPEELVNMCLAATQAICVVSLKKVFKGKQKLNVVKAPQVVRIMNLAGIWGLHTYLQELAARGGYLASDVCTDKKRINRAGQLAVFILAKPHNIDPVSEASMDIFVDNMLPTIRQMDFEISRKEYKLLLEQNVRWGYEFARILTFGK